MLLTAAWRRLLVAGAAVAVLWVAVLLVVPSTPSTAPAQPSLRVPRVPVVVGVSDTGPLRTVVRSGLEAPGGGHNLELNRTQDGRAKLAEPEPMGCHLRR